MKTIIESDREPVIDHKTDTEKAKEIIDMIEDHTAKQETLKPKKSSSNKWVWIITAILIVLIIAGLMYYGNLQKKKDESN
jgi:cytochrome c-type biogenesis protein CcmH/NrfF